MIVSDPSPRPRADQRALAAVAHDLLRSGVGAKMTTSVAFQERLDVGSGTVQKATRHLTDIGAARLRVRGHQGTIIEALDPALMWRAADMPPLRIVLPPAGAIESAAIGVSVHDQLARSHVPVEFDFVRGAHRRIERLCDAGQPTAVVISRGAARALGLLDATTHSSLDLGPGSYYHQDSLVLLRRRESPHSRLRVALDSESFDHTTLTERQFGSRADVDYIDCPFVRVPAALLDDRADVGVWHRVVSIISPAQAGLQVTTLAPTPPIDDSDDQFANALLVWLAEHREIEALLATINIEEIAERRRTLVRLGVDAPEISDEVPWL